MPDSKTQHATPRTAVVTGAGRGIGAAIARELARRDYQVVVNYRTDRVSAEAVVAEIEAAGGTAAAVQADVCDPTQAHALIAAAVGHFAHVDLLVCNANVGLARGGSVLDTDWSVFSGKVLDELAAAFHPTQAALPGMIEAGSGRVLYITSEAARGPGGTGLVSHGVAKAALNLFAAHVARENAPLGVGVNVISAGLVRTAATEQIPPDLFHQFESRIPAGRAGEPDDIARAVAFLASDEADYVVGSVLALNGGSHLGV